MNINQEQELLKRNAELENELASRNREIEIEASLEKVRAKALAMKEPPDMLHVCRRISDQLLQLGFKEVRNVQTVIIYQQKHEYINYQYFTPYNKDVVEIIDYRLHPDVRDFTEKMLKSPDAYYYRAFEGEDLKVWREYRKQTNQLDDPKLDEATSSHYYFYSIGSGALGVTTYAPLSEDEVSLFKRFRNVFALAYRRFIDIEKAQAQAREAKIETALERVRARTMAMYQSTELAETASVLFQQIKELGFETWSCGFCIWTKNDLAEVWMAADSGGLLPPMMIPYKEELTHAKIYEASLRGELVHDKVWEGKELEKHYAFLKTIPSVKVAIEMMEKSGLRLPDRQCYYAGFFKQGYLLLITKEPNSELKELSKRFASVFDLTYTRFLDLRKAEAQAREAQIETALERVRSRTMGMHKSDELLEVVASVFQQMQLLGFNLNLCNIVLIDSKTLEADYWASGSEQAILPESYHIPYFDHPLYQYQLSTWKNANPLAVFELTGELKQSWDEILFTKTDLKRLPDSTKRMMKQLDKVTISSVAIKHGLLQAIGTEQLSNDDVSILSRFAKVFEQTYTRFLDLQKAEAQAREAQIEAAVEKVRSRSLAMHKSEELQEVVHTVFEKLKELNVDFYTAIIILFTEGSRDIIWWLESKANQQYSKMLVPYTPISYFNDLIKIRESGGDLLSKCYSFDEKNELFHHLFEHTNFKYVPEKQKQFLLEAEFATMSVGLVRNTGIHITSYSKKTFSDQDNQVIKRFANVFDQSYTRFLDLQKAEAQAREAQIQLSLERVRARAMAMYHSDELNDVLSVLFEQFDALNFNPVFAHLSLFDLEKNLTTLRITGKGGKRSMAQKTVAIDAMNEWKEELANWKASKPSSISRIYYPKEVVPQIWNLFGDLFGQLPDDSKIYPDDFQNGLYCVQGNTGFGYIGFNQTREATEEEKDIILRFAIEFGRVYQRFLDLQKAEAQAREAKIEAALERTRTQSMIMQHSKELDDTLGVFHEQVLLLGINSAFSFLWLPDEKNERHIFWAAWEEDKNGSTVFNSKAINYPLDRNEPATAQCLVDWKSNEPVYSYHVPPAAVENYFAAWKELLDGVEKLKSEYFQAGLHYVEAFMKYGCFGVMVATDLTDDEKKILNRFAIEFERTYTRFLDLQKAEEQAREAQIEAALERVRAKVMAMSNSGDLNETSLVFGEQLRKLGIDWQFSYFWLVEEAKNENTFWITWPDNKTSFTTYTLAEAEEYFNDCLISWRAGVKIHDNYVPPEGVQEWLDTFQRIADDAGGEAKKLMVPQTFAGGVYYYDAMMKYGSFGICINKAATDEEKKIQCRFAIEFERAYTRFLDLKQAEAQARESQIELGLERVRARAMAMQKSDELKELIGTVSTELSKLDLILDRCFIIIFDVKTDSSKWWMANPETPSNPTGLFMQYHEMPPYLAYLEAWKTRQLKWQYILEGENKKEWDEFIFSETEFAYLPDFVSANMRANKKVFLNASFNSFGCLTLATLEPLSGEHFDIMLRFAKVFDLTYTRFNDLKQAEAQTREARIETALEKVRASTMAMQRSEDLSQTAFVLFNQFKELGEAPERIFIATFDDHDSGLIDLWGTDQGGSQLNKLFKLPVNEPTMVSKIIAAWREKKRSLVVDLQGEELQTYVGFLKQAGIPVTDGIMPDRRVQTVGCFSNGVIGVTTSEPQSSESVQLLERFAGVFDLTYTRFLDLQKAEAQAREAKIEAALERVRARALAMQIPEELKDVAQVLRTEMGSLGVEELETSSIYIHSDNAEMAECWYALKDPKETEKRMVADHIQLDLTDTWVGREMQKFYTSDKHQTSIVMQGARRKEWIEYCYKHSPVFSGFYGETIPDRTYHLYKFSHGYIGAAAPGEISNESWRLLSRAASVFSLAYSRFRDLSQARIDLIKLKEEKKKAEDALTELQATQKQLIQAEKMASLGELTAGIAHEIQNPLNFVNNFSDVSNELLEEMKAELEKGNAEAAKAIAVDVKENLEKILHHGKRADAIVKGMLQHSRNSSGQKELTDINVLAEEYLRLAYHGLRAKDKFFNAKFETDLDPSINKINIVPQEIGRVILNLINNSFYALSEKKKNTGNGYEPIVTVSTKAIKPPLGGLPAGQAGLGVVEIRVKDNGNGIPQKVLNKIFQPFFTTKPTGEGTGLGLSLSYDIITKGHDGDIKVETKEGEGSEFIISLPVN